MAFEGTMALRSVVPLEQAHTQFDQPAFNDDCETGGGGSSPRLDNDGDEKSDGRHENGDGQRRRSSQVSLMRAIRQPQLDLTNAIQANTVPKEEPKEEAKAPLPPGKRHHYLRGDKVPLPPGKRYHYFLSHKKRHSEYSTVPEQVAKCFHDSLELSGFVGWFDIDNLKRITRESLREAIAECCTVIVCLHDETMDSEWCSFEWSCARELGIPIKCVVDMQRHSKEKILDRCLADFPELMVFQWTELTEFHRRTCVHDLGSFVRDIVRVSIEAAKLEDPRRKSTRIFSFESDAELEDPRQALVVGGDREAHLLHPWCERMMILGGVPFRTDEHFATRVWVRLMMCGKFLCTLACIIRLIYRTGPSYTDWPSCAFTVAFHVWTLIGSARLLVLLRSPSFKALLTTLKGRTASALGRRLYAASGAAGVFTLVATLLVSIWIYTWSMPAFLHDFYIGAEASTSRRSFGIMSAVIFGIGIPPIVAAFFVNWMLIHALSLISTIQIVASFDEIDRAIAMGGIRAFIREDANAVGGLEPEPRALTRFQRRWQLGLVQYEDVRRSVAPMLLSGLAYNIGGALLSPIYWALDYEGEGGLPLGLDAKSPVLYADGRWIAINRVLCINAVSIFSCILCVYPPLLCTIRLARLQRAQQRLVFLCADQQVLVSTVCSSTDLTYRIVAGIVPVTPSTALLFVAALIFVPSVIKPALLQTTRRAIEQANPDLS